VTLDNLGSNPTEFEVNLGTKKPGEHLPFEHVFDPEGATPPQLPPMINSLHLSAV
jgi:hypothetical protein